MRRHTDYKIYIYIYLQLQHKLAVLRAQYNELMVNKALASLNRLKSTYLCQGEKAGKLLACYL